MNMQKGTCFNSASLTEPTLHTHTLTATYGNNVDRYQTGRHNK